MIRSCDRKLCSTFTYVVVPAIHLLAISLPNTHGQCPPNLPAPPSGGLPAIVEGDLASATIDFGDATVGIDGCGRFLTASAVQRPIDTDLGLLLIQRFFPDGTPDGPVENISVLNPLWPPLMAQGHCTPSVAVSPAGHVRVSWVAECIDCQPNGGPQVVTSDFDFAAPAVPQSAQPGSNSLLNREPSAATSDAVPAGANLGGVAWFNSGAAGTLGLRLDLDATMPEVVRPCGARCFEEWQPAVCMRANGDTVLVWSEAENPLLQDSPFNIALRVQLADGTIVHEIAGQGGGWVNDPVAEIPSSRQLSPAVALSSNGDIVVCWSGSRLLGCSGAGFRVFARRFQWAGGLNPVTIVSEPFIVDNDPDIAAAPLASVNAHPTVALTNSTNPALQGRFVIAWNASRAEVGGGEEIHAQYFDSDGRAMGREFRVNQADGPTDPISGAALRRLGRSAQHSLAYGPDGQVGPLHGRVVVTAIRSVARAAHTSHCCRRTLPT